MSKLKENKNLSYIAITIGVAISIFSQNYFLLPNQISTGGFSGIATILYYLFGLPVGITMLVLNVPLFLVSFKKLGSGFVLRSLYAMVMYSLLTDLFPIRPLTEDMLLASIYGGVLMGLGLGISVYFGGSTGGTDTLGMLIHHKFKFISVSVGMLAIDVLVVVATGIVFDIQTALFAIVGLYISTKVMEIFTEGINRASAFLIISSKYQEIEEQILQEMDRGVTELSARGGYGGHEDPALLCVVEKGREVSWVKEIVHKIDPKAFIVFWEAKEVTGEGFTFGDKPRREKAKVEKTDASL